MPLNDKAKLDPDRGQCLECLPILGRKRYNSFPTPYYIYYDNSITHFVFTVYKN